MIKEIVRFLEPTVIPINGMELKVLQAYRKFHNINQMNS